METGALGKLYLPGEIIIRQGEVGDCMYVIQEGQVAVLVEEDGHEVLLMVRGPGEFFGEMAIFERHARSATVRALGQTRVLTLDKGSLLRRITEDPTLAFHLLQHMSAHLRDLTRQIAWLTRDEELRQMRQAVRPGPGDYAASEAVGALPQLE
jgi:CRP/FNR family cyclic AMP-dependent transcriptional regulator